METYRDMLTPAGEDLMFRAFYEPFGPALIAEMRQPAVLAALGEDGLADLVNYFAGVPALNNGRCLAAGIGSTITLLGKQTRVFSDFLGPFRPRI